MYVKKNPMDYSNCSIRIAIDVLTKSWNAQSILEINRGVARPCDLERITGVAPKRVLTKQLGELEKMGILEKKIYPILPLKVEYSLTAIGKELISIIEQMEKWGDKHKAALIDNTGG